MRRARSFVLGLLLPVLLLSPQFAQAHSASTFYSGGGGVWASGIWVNWYSKGFPSSSYVDRLKNGSAQWNAASGSSSAEPDFSYVGGTSTGPSSPCSASLNGAYWYNLDPLVGEYVLGYTPFCKNTSGRVYRFTMYIDSTQSWYTGTGDSVGTFTADLWSVASHEFGHATGWYGHYSTSETICENNGSQATMCRTIHLGTVRMRTLADHDIHTFNAAY